MSTALPQALNQGGASAGELQQLKALACKRCQYKKLKCSKTVPCTACQKAGVECEYRQVNRKRRPASQDHVFLLQNRVAWLEDFILSLQNASSSDRDSRLRTINLTSTSSSRAAACTTTQTQPDSAFYRTSNLHVTCDGSLSFHGPTSIYHASFDNNSGRPDWNNQSSPVRDAAFKNADHVLKHFDINIDAEIITQTLLLFFKWQYPNYVFIYRDAFLRDHYGVRQGGKYWSTSLLLSICALGSLMLPESERGDFGGRCHDAAVSIAIVADLVHPSITAVQTFLCLAFYEIGLSNLSKGWAFSGIAFRMAQDLGFQKDPETWAFIRQSFNSNEDIEARRRIYWGCYVSDKLISLILGRPVQLLYNEAEVYELATQPDPAFVLPWRSVGFNDDAYREYTNISMIPYVKEQIKLARIVEHMLSLMSSGSDQSMSSHRPYLDSLNCNLLEWRRGLSDWADYKMWDTADQPLKPSIAAIHLLYNATRIALNFNIAVICEGSNHREQAREVCTLAVTEIHSILRRFRKQHELRNSPLVMVYALAQAIRASKAFGATEETKSLIKGLSEPAKTWPLADMIISGRL